MTWAHTQEWFKEQFELTEPKNLLDDWFEKEIYSLLVEITEDINK